MNIYLYGPPGSGKSTCGRLLADALELPFYDLDIEIETQSNLSIPQIFAEEGEAGFRQREKQALQQVGRKQDSVVALGGGALLDPDNRKQAETSGQVICLRAELPALLRRLNSTRPDRPLLSNDLASQLTALLAAREPHYSSFSLQLDTTRLAPAEATWQAQIQLGRFRVTGMGKPYDVLIQNGNIDRLGQELSSRKLKGAVALVSDEQVAPLYADRAVQSLETAGYACQAIVLPSGERHKTMATIAQLWEGFLSAGLDRSSTVVALGGGVVTDLAGFAAGTYLRGVRWVAVPTTLLGMVDASLGGKTGADLPQGKNLVGLFHPPSLVQVDPALLNSLPREELRCGLAEAIKHAVIGDPDLFERLQPGWEGLPKQTSGKIDWEALVRRACAVKIRILLVDPYEQGEREELNFGHTIGHAVERASQFQIRHGEAIAIGMVAEARLAEEVSLAESGLSEQIEQTLQAFELPIRIPNGLDPEALRRGLKVDKKRRSGVARLALPVCIGKVQYGFEMAEEELWSRCLSSMDRT